MDTMAWEEPLSHRMKIERNLNFSTISNDEDEFGFSRKKTARDPMSHRIIEKRRRDRMNNCLADLSRLVPTNYIKKGRGRIEKTEIIEMAIKHLKHLQAHPCDDPANCEVAKTTEADHKRQYRLGFQECLSETVRFVLECGEVPADSGRMVAHLQKHYEKVAGGLCYSEAALMSEDSKSNLQMDVDFATEPPFPFQEVKKEEPSQLREMLQNPGVPKKQTQELAPKTEEGYYKFKNNIKHRFHQDLRHHTSSPTDSSYHSDRPDDDSSVPRVIHVPEPVRPTLRNSPEHSGSTDNNTNATLHRPLSGSGISFSPDSKRICSPRSGSNQEPGHAFSPYPTSHPAAELSVKIPYPNPAWPDSQLHETASSCGSPPPAARSSNGSSSGYSTNGGPSHSPALSPYRSPSPLHPGAVPVFALHPKGSFYVPLTLESSLLVPYMATTSADDPAPVLHPISICVNLSHHSEKVASQYRPSSFLMDKFQDRYVHSDGHLYYPPASPVRNGCST